MPMCGAARSPGKLRKQGLCGPLVDYEIGDAVPSQGGAKPPDLIRPRHHPLAPRRSSDDRMRRAARALIQRDAVAPPVSAEDTVATSPRTPSESSRA